MEGKVKGDIYYTTIQKPKTVAWEVSFEGLYPSEEESSNMTLVQKRPLNSTAKALF